MLDLLPSNTNLEAFKTSISNRTTQIGYDIYVRKGTTNFGISLSLVRIVEAILFNKNIIMNVSSYVEGEYGLSDVYIGVPTVINGNGADRIIELALSKEELSQLHHSVDIILDYHDKPMLSLIKCAIPKVSEQGAGQKLIRNPTCFVCRISFEFLFLGPHSHFMFQSNYHTLVSIDVRSVAYL